MATLYYRMNTTCHVLRVPMFKMCVIMLLMFRWTVSYSIGAMRMRFISGLYYVNNSSLQFLINVTAKQELIKVIGLMGLGRNKVGLLENVWCDICKHCINCK